MLLSLNVNNNNYIHHLDIKYVMKTARLYIIHDEQYQLISNMVPHQEYNVWMAKVPACFHTKCLFHAKYVLVI